MVFWLHVPLWRARRAEVLTIARTILTITRLSSINTPSSQRKRSVLTKRSGKLKILGPNGRFSSTGQPRSARRVGQGVFRIAIRDEEMTKGAMLEYFPFPS